TPGIGGMIYRRQNACTQPCTASGGDQAIVEGRVSLAGKHDQWLVREIHGNREGRLLGCRMPSPQPCSACCILENPKRSEAIGAPLRSEAYGEIDLAFVQRSRLLCRAQQ